MERNLTLEKALEMFLPLTDEEKRKVIEYMEGLKKEK